MSPAGGPTEEPTEAPADGPPSGGRAGDGTVHEGRVVATGDRTYVLRWCDGTLTVTADRLVVQGVPHANGRPRAPVVTERSQLATLHLRCGLFGAGLRRETPAGYRSHVLRTRAPAPLLADLRAHAWPVRVTGWRRPR